MNGCLVGVREDAAVAAQHVVNGFGEKDAVGGNRAVAVDLNSPIDKPVRAIERVRLDLRSGDVRPKRQRVILRRLREEAAARSNRLDRRRRLHQHHESLFDHLLSVSTPSRMTSVNASSAAWLDESNPGRMNGCAAPCTDPNSTNMPHVPGESLPFDLSFSGPMVTVPDSCFAERTIFIPMESRSSPGCRRFVATFKSGARLFALGTIKSPPAFSALRSARFASFGPACASASSTPLRPCTSTLMSMFVSVGGTARLLYVFLPIARQFSFRTTSSSRTFSTDWIRYRPFSACTCMLARIPAC